MSTNDGLGDVALSWANVLLSGFELFAVLFEAFVFCLDNNVGSTAFCIPCSPFDEITSGTGAGIVPVSQEQLLASHSYSTI